MHPLRKVIIRWLLAVSTKTHVPFNAANAYMFETTSALSSLQDVIHEEYDTDTEMSHVQEELSHPVSPDASEIEADIELPFEKFHDALPYEEMNVPHCKDNDNLIEFTHTTLWKCCRIEYEICLE